MEGILSTLSSSKSAALLERLTCRDTHSGPSRLSSTLGSACSALGAISNKVEELLHKTESTVPRTLTESQVQLSTKRARSPSRENEMTSPPFSKPRKTKVSLFGTSWTPTELPLSDTIKESSVYGPSSVSTELSRQKCFGSTDPQDSVSHSSVPVSPQTPFTKTCLAIGGVDTTPTNTTTLCLKTTDAISPSSMLCYGCSTSRSLAYKLKEAMSILELSEFLFPLPGPLLRPGLVELKRSYNSCFDALKLLLNSLLVHLQTTDGSLLIKYSIKDLQLTSLLMTLVQEINHLVLQSRPPKRLSLKMPQAEELDDV
nr:MAG: hypothetical protein [Chemarfal virus 48]